MNKDKINALWSDIQHYGERLKQEDFVDNNFGYCTLFGYRYNNDVYCATMINGKLALLEKGYAVREESYIDGRKIETKKIFLPIGYKIMEE